ncbi:MAG: hypothetical protein Q4B65_00265 [Candidatus Saccharibacteria bacterium]|nr:hypothetical protein [Candidatus Saccharibacteria bacterium]
MSTEKKVKKEGIFSFLKVIIWLVASVAYFKFITPGFAAFLLSIETFWLLSLVMPIVSHSESVFGAFATFLTFAGLFAGLLIGAGFWVTFFLMLVVLIIWSIVSFAIWMMANEGPYV